MTNPFAGDLSSLDDKDETYNEAVEVLLELADAIQTKFAGLANVKVGVAPGFTVNMGQQYKFYVQIVEDPDKKAGAYTDVLFRACVPTEGYPVVVGLFGDEKRKCKDREELLDVLRSLLKNKDFALRLRSLRTLAKHQATEL